MTEAEAEIAAEERWVELGRELLVSLDLEKELECPVCMSVRQGRIYECPNAHIICQKCHDKGPYINDVG